MTERPQSSDSEPKSGDSGFGEELERFLGAASELGLRDDIEECWDCLWMLWTGGSPCLDRQALACERAKRDGAVADSDGSFHENLREGIVEFITGSVFPPAANPESVRLTELLFKGLAATYEEAGENPKNAASHALGVLRDLARRPEQFSEIRSVAGLTEDPFLNTVAGARNASVQSAGYDPLIPEDLYLSPEDTQIESGLHTQESREARKSRLFGPKVPNPPEDHENSLWFLRRLRFGEEDWPQSIP